MLNASVFESPFRPVPDCAVSVLTNAVPGLASRFEGTVAVIVVGSTNVDASFCPFHCTTVVLLNPLNWLAFTVSQNEPVPAGNPFGATFVSVAPVLYWIELL